MRRVYRLPSRFCLLLLVIGIYEGAIPVSYDAYDDPHPLPDVEIEE